MTDAQLKSLRELPKVITNPGARWSEKPSFIRFRGSAFLTQREPPKTGRNNVSLSICAKIDSTT